MAPGSDQFHLLAEHSPDPIFIGSAGVFVYLNPAAVRLFGVADADRLIGTPLLECVHPGSRPAVGARLRGLQEQPTPLPALELILLQADGSPVQVELSAVPFLHEDEPAALLFAREIAGRRKAEQAWREERAFLRLVIDACPNLIFVKDRDGRFLLANEALARAYATRVEAVEGRTDADFNANADEVASFQRADREVIDSRLGKLIPEEAVTYADGTVHWYCTSKTPLLREDGGCNLVLGVATDISALKQVEAEKLKAQQLLQAIIDNTTAVIFVKDLDGRYLLINRRYSELFHVSNTEMLGRTDADLFPAQVVEALHSADQRVLEAGAPLEFEELVPHDDGLHTYIALKFPLYDADGRACAVCGIATDITERNRARDALLRLNAEYRTLFDAAPVACVVWGSGYRITEWNWRAEQMFGWRREEVLGRSFPEILFREDAQRVRPVVDAVVRDGATTPSIDRALTRSGELITCEWHNAALPPADGGARRVMSMFIDITARVRAEAEVRQLNAQLERRVAERTRDLDAKEQLLREALSLNASILASSAIAIAAYRGDGQCVMVNPALAELAGGTVPEMLAQNFRQLASWHSSGLRAAAEAALASGDRVEYETEFRTTFGRDIWVQCHFSRFVSGGEPHLLMMLHDITAKRRAEEELRLAASVFHSSAEGVLVTDAETRIISVNPAFCEITGYSEGEALGRKPSLLRSDRQDAAFYRAMWERLARDGRWQGEIWNRRKDGEAYLEWLTINRIDDLQGRPVRYVSVFHDITELHRKDERIRHIAFHDALTGLPNRALLQDRLQHAVDRAQREAKRLSVAFLDLDRFKGINDTLGHDVGDLLLQNVAARIRGRLRAADTAARMGGDEFVIVMEDLRDTGDSAAIAAELIAEIARPMELRGHQVQVGASLGMAFYPEDGNDAVELMKRADTAMYAAKSAGRNTFRFFRPEMLERTSERLRLEMELRHAIQAGELQLHYQPKVALATGRISGVEALVRWQHPRRGFLPPLEFIPLAEESGLIVALGEWVLEEACRQSAAWLARGLRIPIAVNVSARQLEQGDLAARIAGLAQRHGIAPGDLEIEITESVVMANPGQAAVLLTRLRDVGVTVAVDDFGTGYSSLAYLRRLPIDVLKIDRSFVMDAERNDEDAQIVKTILALGQTLKLKVVAEGIETPGQAELLRAIGCDTGQGYHFARPLPAAELEAWIAERSDG